MSVVVVVVAAAAAALAAVVVVGGCVGVFVCSIDHHLPLVAGVRITSSSAMLGRLQYIMLSVNLVQSVVVIVSWVLVVIVLRHDAQTQAAIQTCQLARARTHARAHA